MHSRVTWTQICAALGACRILLVEPGRQDMMKKIRANCSQVPCNHPAITLQSPCCRPESTLHAPLFVADGEQDDILFALRDDAMAKHVAKTTTTTTTTTHAHMAEEAAQPQFDD